MGPIHCSSACDPWAVTRSDTSLDDVGRGDEKEVRTVLEDLHHHPLLLPLHHHHHGADASLASSYDDGGRLYP